jgi:predicted secreted protein
MKYLIAALLALTLGSVATSFAQNAQEDDKRLLNLQKEKEKYKRLSDPVARTLSDIKISEILVSLISDAVKAGNKELMDGRVAEYTLTIQDAHDVMMGTGRDAHKKSQGFKDLEIALRRQANQLKDIGTALTLDQREPIDKARQKASSLRDDLIRALFGG